MEDVKAAEPVRFDFEGSLRQARRLWELADHLDALHRSRKTDAHRALDGWTGKHADDFHTRTANESKSIRNIAEGLRAEARAWAESWKNAMDEQNRRNRAKQVDEIRARRSWVEAHIGDLLHGDDSNAQVPPPTVMSIPQPPHFNPTCG